MPRDNFDNDGANPKNRGRDKKRLRMEIGSGLTYDFLYKLSRRSSRGRVIDWPE